MTDGSTRENGTERNREISILLPCKNEEKALQACLDEIRETVSKNKLDAEIIVVDNRSEDGSRRILDKNLLTFPELKIVTEEHDGYGRAYLKGFESAVGKYIFMADADGTYSFRDIPRFLDEIKKGSDMVIGNRFAEKLPKGTMPILHKLIGNPLLSCLTRLFFKVKVNDIHCGERMITRKALSQITLYTAGMEFASEMVIKVARRGLKISELPVSYAPRLGESKLKPFSDGWRHMRFLLLYSPFFLFMLPGFILLFVGIVSMAILYFFDIHIFGIQFYFHPLFLSAVLVLAGYQLIFFAGFSKVYAVTHLGDQDRSVIRLFKHITLEKAGLFGLLIAALGGILYIYIFAKWLSSGLGSLNETKNSIVALTLSALGMQTIFSAFMLSTLGIKER
jgi:glycosyltransferase involved in cell wall biosynthesis